MRSRDRRFGKGDQMAHQMEDDAAHALWSLDRQIYAVYEKCTHLTLHSVRLSRLPIPVGGGTQLQQICGLLTDAAHRGE